LLASQPVEASHDPALRLPLSRLRVIERTYQIIREND
jgi:hypothetical protein